LSFVAALSPGSSHQSLWLVYSISAAGQTGITLGGERKECALKVQKYFKKQADCFAFSN
jgi:hypothetical protein